MAWLLLGRRGHHNRTAAPGVLQHRVHATSQHCTRAPAADPARDRIRHRAVFEPAIASATRESYLGGADARVRSRAAVGRSRCRVGGCTREVGMLSHPHSRSLPPGQLPSDSRREYGYRRQPPGAEQIFALGPAVIRRARSGPGDIAAFPLTEPRIRLSVIEECSTVNVRDCRRQRHKHRSNC